MQIPPLTCSERTRLASSCKDFEHLPACRLQGPLLPLADRTLCDVLVEAQELLDECRDPCDLEAAAADFRASFFPSPAICDALEGICVAFGFSPTVLL